MAASSSSQFGTVNGLVITLRCHSARMSHATAADIAFGPPVRWTPRCAHRTLQRIAASEQLMRRKSDRAVESAPRQVGFDSVQPEQRVVLLQHSSAVGSWSVLWSPRNALLSLALLV